MPMQSYGDRERLNSRRDSDKPEKPSGKEKGNGKENNRRESADTVRSEESEKGDGLGELKTKPARRHVRDRRRGSIFPSATLPSITGAAASQPQYAIPQMLFIPQLDGIQRTQKILDMRLQHLQTQTETIMVTSGMLLLITSY